MAAAPRPTLVMLAGPNGSGKSTLYETRVKPSLAVPFINADIIQRDELKDLDVAAAYKAAKIAADRRRDYLAARKSFATESVFSHTSKLDLIREAKGLGYRVLVFHVSVKDPKLSLARVAERVKEGGHDVPEDKIVARYHRSGPLIRQAVLMADAAHVFDNSKLNLPPERMLSFLVGKLTFAAPVLPNWVIEIYDEALVV